MKQTLIKDVYNALQLLAAKMDASNQHSKEEVDRIDTLSVHLVNMVEQAKLSLETTKQRLEDFEYTVNQKSFIVEDIDGILELLKGENYEQQ